MNKILLIEDDIALNENLGFILNKNNFSLMTAENGKTGIELARSSKPDAVVCDIMLPDIDGYQIIKSIKENMGIKDIPFLFISAKSTVTDIEKGMKLGADDYLVKPFKANLLIKSLNTLFEKKSTYKGNILILDKDENFSNELALSLEKNYYKCHVSSNGNSVIELTESNKIDLILCNIDLNDIDGYSVIKKIKENNSTRNIPIYILGAEYNSIIFWKVINMEADDYLVKPINFEEILRIIDIRIPGVRTDKVERLITIDNIQIPNKKISYQLNDHLLSKYSENLTDTINYQLEMKDQLSKPLPPFDTFNDSDNYEMNYFLSNRNVSRDYEQFIHRGMAVVLVNLTRADLKESLNFQKYLLEILQHNFTRILVDLSPTNFMDSAFTGVLIEAGRKLKLVNNGELRIVINPKNSLTNPILIDRLEKKFKTYDDLNLAINCFNLPDKLREVQTGNLSSTLRSL
jgi:DNA-binding response OmpR family regulator/anti-anti-sigma regulatory factor